MPIVIGAKQVAEKFECLHNYFLFGEIRALDIRLKIFMTDK
jgi:hypothetical protein